VNEHALDAHHEGPHEGHEGEHHHEEASIFPPIVGIGAMAMLFGLAANWNHLPWGNGLSLIGIAVLLTGMIGWWWELVQANKSDETTLIGTVDEVQKIMRVGFGFFIGSEVMFFGAFFAYYFYIRLHAPSWPPAGYEALPLLPAMINTALLVTSGFLFMKGEHMLAHGHGQDKKWTIVAWMTSAVVLGLIFLGVQANEWYELMVHKNFNISDGTMGTAFYLLTGFHGFHVIIGALMLMTVTVRVALGHFTEKKHFAMTAAGWYWHFVDVVWIGLVAVLYVWAH
jgi:cytochrome c oxidase subunit 3